MTDNTVKQPQRSSLPRSQFAQVMRLLSRLMLTLLSPPLRTGKTLATANGSWPGGNDDAGMLKTSWLQSPVMPDCATEKQRERMVLERAIQRCALPWTWLQASVLGLEPGSTADTGNPQAFPPIGSSSHFNSPLVHRRGPTASFMSRSLKIPKLSPQPPRGGDHGMRVRDWCIVEGWHMGALMLQ